MNMNSNEAKSPDAKLIVLAILAAALLVFVTFRYLNRTKSNLPPLFPVFGRVTVDGQPLDRGMIHFAPEKSRGAAHLQYSSAEIQADGGFTLKTNSQPGAPLGWYKVIVIATETPIPENPTNWTPDWLVHKKYTQRGSTDLEIEVIESPSPGTYDLALER